MSSNSSHLRTSASARAFASSADSVKSATSRPSTTHLPAPIRSGTNGTKAPIPARNQSSLQAKRASRIGTRCGTKRSLHERALTATAARRGSRRSRHSGSAHDNRDESAVTTRYLRDALNGVLAGDEPPVAETAPVGCTVKWKS